MAVPDDLVHKFFDWAGWIVGAVATGIAGLMSRQYFKDRSTLAELQRKMAEVDAIRVRTDDGRSALVAVAELDTRINTLSSAMETVVERQDACERNQDTMQNILTEIKTDVRWLRKERENGHG